jgi:hypothetical protein
LIAVQRATCTSSRSLIWFLVPQHNREAAMATMRAKHCAGVSLSASVES